VKWCWNELTEHEFLSNNSKYVNILDSKKKSCHFLNGYFGIGDMKNIPSTKTQLCLVVRIQVLIRQWLTFRNTDWCWHIHMYIWIKLITGIKATLEKQGLKSETSERISCLTVFSHHVSLFLQPQFYDWFYSTDYHMSR